MNDKTRELLAGPNYASLTVVLPSGMPSSHMMWVGTDDDHVLINTEIHRFKFKHLGVGAKASVLVFESAFSWAEIRGTVVEHIGGAAARAHIDELSQVYTGGPYGNEVQSERVIVKIRPNYDMAFPPAGH